MSERLLPAGIFSIKLPASGSMGREATSDILRAPALEEMDRSVGAWERGKVMSRPLPGFARNSLATCFLGSEFVA